MGISDSSDTQLKFAGNYLSLECYTAVYYIVYQYIAHR
jgi:hypothetical protein